MTKITKKEIGFSGAWNASVCKMVLDIENKDIHFYIAKGDAMNEVDYQEFIFEFHSTAWQCIESDKLREDYLKFERAIDEYINEYCGMVGCN